METESQKIEITLDYPISVESILSISFNYEGFKVIFEYILEILRKHEAALSKLSQPKSDDSTFEELFKLRQDLQRLQDLSTSHSSSIENLNTSHQSLESTQTSLHHAQDSMKNTLNDLESSQQSIESGLKSLEKSQKQALDQINSLDNEQQNLKAATASQKRTIEGHSESLAEILARLDRTEEEISKSLRSLEQIKKEVENQSTRVEKNEWAVLDVKEKVERQTGIINDHERRLHQLELDIEQTMKAIKSLGGEVQQISKPVEPVIHEVVASPDNSSLNILRDSINDLTRQIKEIELRLSGAEDTGNKAKESSEKNENGLKRLENEVKDLEDYLKRLEEMMKKASGKPIDVSDFKSDVSRDELDSLRKLLRQLEDSLRTKASSDELEALKKLLKSLEDSLKKKANLDDLDDLRHSSVPGGPPPDLKGLRELQHKFEDLQRQLSDLLSSKPSSDPKALKDLNSRLDDLAKQISALTSRLDDLGSRVSLIEVSLNKKANKSDLDELRKGSLVDPRPSPRSDDSGDSSKLLQLTRRLGSLEDQLKKLVLPEGHDLIFIFNTLIKLNTDYKDFKDKYDKSHRELWAKLKDLEELINKKASIEDLRALEDLLRKLLKDMADEFLKKFAEKIETKRALKYLEKLIRDQETFKVIPEGDDAMLARKPLGGWSCASCQKELEKLIGKVAPYQPWNKMPYRDPADRIARAGPGFSRMLATIQPEALTNRTRNSAMRNVSPPITHAEDDQEAVSLPPVKRSTDRPLTTL